MRLFRFHTGHRSSKVLFISLSVLAIFALTIVPASAKSITGILQGVWSPDGSQLAVAVGDTDQAAWSIYTVNTTDLSAVKLVSGAYSPVWSPDGEAIAFSKPEVDGIYTIPADGSGTVTELADSGYLPAWSPDGETLAYVMGDTVYTMNADGSNQQPLTHERTPYVVTPTWSPDGQSLAFIAVGSNTDQGTLYVVNAESSELQKLSESLVSMNALSWSPDSQQIAVVSDCGTQTGLCVMNADGSESHKIGSGDGAQWSPDGSQIAYVANERLCTVESSGEGQHCFTDLPLLNFSDLSWSPDGQQLLFFSVQPSEEESPESMHSTAYLVNADGSNLRTLPEING